MTMTILLIRNGDLMPLTLPFEGAEHVLSSDPCPFCRASPCAVVGAGQRIAEDDRAYEADAFCAACRNPLGLMRVEVPTLFGLREDEAVLRHGRARVY